MRNEHVINNVKFMNVKKAFQSHEARSVSIGKLHRQIVVPQDAAIVAAGMRSRYPGP